MLQKIFLIIILLIVVNFSFSVNPIVSTISSSTFFGGSNGENTESIIEGRNGDIYIAGSMSSSNLALGVNGYDTSYNSNSDGFIACFSEDLTTLKAFTYIGGSSADFLYNMVQDPNGTIYVIGSTLSTDFPTTNQCYDNTCGSDGNCNYDGSFYYNDAILVALDENLSTLLYSTYLGGNKREYGYGISLNKAGNLLLIGWTESTNFPISTGAYDTSFNSGSYDVFVSEMNSQLSTLNYSTYLGGNGYDFGYFVYENTQGNIVTFSTTSSTDYPTSNSAFDKTHNGDYDIAVSILNADLSSIQASTYIGGSSKEKVYGGIIDSNDNVLLTGYTSSSDYPVTSGSYSTTFSGTNDIVVTLLDSSLSAITSTFIGGSNDDRAYDIRLDNNGNPVITGYSYSSDFPISSDAYDSLYSGWQDVVVVNFHSLNLASITSTFIGGTFNEEAQALLCHSNGSIYITGFTNSMDYPATNSYDLLPNGDDDVFISQFSSLISSTHKPIIRNANCFSYSDNRLQFHIAEPAMVSYSIYSLEGRLLYYNPIGYIPKGIYDYPLPEINSEMMFIQAKMGSQFQNLKIQR